MLRLNIISTTVQSIFYQKLGKVFLSQTIFFLVVAFITLNYLLDFFQETLLISFSDTLPYNTLFTLNYNKFLSMNALSFNLLDVYLYPFIYVFLLITCLSIIFCLSYNRDELISFMFYCQVILFAGYLLFFTDSLIIFFFAYEMLLVPSFFILYKFAKTRRCIEAAYLMFF
jgi:formate hydrogenlyase subunit 3/multisubunit Na+/H+ antiporter MnhD subunit